MKKLGFFLFPIAVLAALFPACKTEEDDFEQDYGYEYFPLEIGKFIVYEVDSTIFDPTADTMVFSTKTFVKEEIVDTLLDNLGNVLYRTERSQRKAEGQPWQIQKVLTQSIQANQAIRTEDNLRFIKLAFPLRQNNGWDGLVHIDPGLIVIVAGESIEAFKGWDYRIESVGEPDTVGLFQLNEVATLREADSENLIELRVSREKYAKGIGLVYREQWILDTQCIDDCIGQTWEEKAEKGFILKQTIISHN